MARLRVFVAVDIDKQIRSAGEELIRKLSDITDGGRWTRPENLHLTMKFLGEVEDRELHDVCKVASQAVAETKRFPLVCQSLGVFPNRDNPTTLWMGVNDSNGILAMLQERLETMLCDKIGIPMERRPYQGHLTLGRIRSKKGQPNEELTKLLDEMADEEFGILKVDELVVYSSELRREGPVYTVVGRSPLPK